jgi:hypothetical protein
MPGYVQQAFYVSIRKTTFNKTAKWHPKTAAEKNSHFSRNYMPWYILIDMAVNILKYCIIKY